MVYSLPAWGWNSSPEKMHNPRQLKRGCGHRPDLPAGDHE